VRGNHVQPNVDWVKHMIWKSIEYPLLATLLSKSELDRIISPILCTGLPRSGIMRNISRDLVFAKECHQGLGIIHPFVTQGLRKLSAWFDCSSTLTTSLITCAWESCTTQCGLGKNFLCEPYKPIGAMIDRCWISTLWEFLDEHQITLETDSPDPTRFHGDGYLMKLVHGLSKSELRTFNYCRIYLRVELLSDIITADGKQVRRNVWAGIEDSLMESLVIAAGNCGEHVLHNWWGLMNKGSYFNHIQE
jgi:hypothetical protein